MNSTIILDYCLGLLSAEQRLDFEKELDKNAPLKEQMKTFQAQLNSEHPAKAKPLASLKDKTWSLLENVNLEKEMDLTNLPLLNKYTDMAAWEKAVTPLLPANLSDYPFMKVLTNTDTVLQVLIMTSCDIPDEVHEDVQESFIILDGECECHIEGKVVTVKAGEYMEIPLHAHHDVKITSERLTGVMQRVKVAA